MGNSRKIRADPAVRPFVRLNASHLLLQIRSLYALTLCCITYSVVIVIMVV